MRISILIITYNQQNIISKAIESAINQDTMPDEIVVSDDCSDDNTYEIVKKYEKRYPNLIRVYKNSKNLGISKNIKKGAERCSGNIITMLSGDDLLKRETIKKVKQSLSNIQNLDYTLILCNTINEFNGKYNFSKKNKVNIKNLKTKTILKKHEFFKIAISKKLILEAEYPEDSIGIWADWCFDYNISNLVRNFIQLDDYLYIYSKNIGISSSTKELNMDISNNKAINYILSKEKKINIREKLFLKFQKKLSIPRSRFKYSFYNRIILMILFLITILDSFKFYRYTLSKVLK